MYVILEKFVLTGVGGMGVLVFVLCILPLADGNNMHLMRAESPGPSVGKLVPKFAQQRLYYMEFIRH